MLNLFIRRSRKPPADVCGRCRSFNNDPRTLEREIPGLTVMGSGDAAVRDQDGICARHQRLTPPRGHCADFQARGQTTDQTGAAAEAEDPKA